MTRPPDPTGTLDPWPELPYAAWRETCATLHLWTQIAGKLRVACAPWVNHGWHVTMFLTARGLTTTPIPYRGQTFEVAFDFIDHHVRTTVSDGGQALLELKPRSVADFYHHLMSQLNGLGVRVGIHGSPNEVEEAIPFALDEKHGSYDPEYANRFWRALSSSALVMQDFRGDFVGKCSPVHFFWGGFDLAVTRFSGSRAPVHPGGAPNLPDRVTREAYSHEVSSAGFWPGGDRYPHAMFYSYAYPAPAGFAEARIEPEAAGWDATLGEFVLPYDAMRSANAPAPELLRFLHSAYEAAAELGGWDRSALEWPPGGRPDAMRVARRAGSSVLR